MAKARDIAALAGLAGLAYANRDKLFGGKKTYNEDAGDQKTSSYTGDTKKVEAKDTKDTAEASTADEGYKSNVLKALATPKAASNDKAGNQGVLPPKSLTPEVKPKPKSKVASGAEASNKTDAMRNASRKPVAKNPNYSNEGRSSTAPAPTTATQGPARNVLEEAKENVRRSNAARSSMAEANRPKMEVGRLPKQGPGLSNFKSGGSVSSRADGIAQRGKTRGKMC